MLNTINLKKLTAKTLIGILMVGGFAAQSNNKQAAALTPTDDVHGLELYYRDSAFQCGKNPTQAIIEVDVYNKNTKRKLKTLSKGEKFATTEVDNIEELSFEFDVSNLTCLSGYTPLLGSMLFDKGDVNSLPNIAGFQGQSSVKQMLKGLDKYKELLLFELGTKDKTSAAYDLQDVVIVVDNNPNFDVDNNGILDKDEIDSDIDNDGLKNFEDLDDDGDNIADVHELYSLSQLSSTGTKEMTHIDNYGNEISVTLPNPPSIGLLPANALNTYNTDQPDYQDTNTDNDQFPDIIEAGDTDLATVPFNSDSSTSGDSIADFRDLDSDDNGIIDDNEVDGDVDGDYTKNFQDLDDDGDGIIDVIEIGSNPNSPTNSDSANDRPDYQDTDSDGDSILDSEEGIKADANYTTSVSITYPNSNGTATSYNLQDYDVSDTKKDGISCASEGTANTCTVTSESIENGKVRITGTMTGLDYQVPNYAD